MTDTSMNQGLKLQYLNSNNMSVMSGKNNPNQSNNDEANRSPSTVPLSAAQMRVLPANLSVKQGAKQAAKGN